MHNVTHNTLCKTHIPSPLVEKVVADGNNFLLIGIYFRRRMTDKVHEK